MIACVQQTNERPKLIQLIHSRLTADDGAAGKEFEELKLKLNRMKVPLRAGGSQVLSLGSGTLHACDTLHCLTND